MDSKEKQMKKQVASTERETNEKTRGVDGEREERERENEKKKKVQSGLFVAYLRSKIRTLGC